MSDFKKILDESVLTEEVKTQIKEAFDAQVKEGVEAQKAVLDTEYATKFVKEKADLSQKIVGMIDESVSAEMQELRQDVKAAKNLEVSYAAKLAKFKEEYAAKLDDRFVAVMAEAIKHEFDELRGDILEARKLNIGKKIIESVKDEMISLGLFEETHELSEKLANTEKKLSESTEKLAKVERTQAVEKLLSNLSGAPREVMATILENVSTDKLEARYEQTLKAVLEQFDGAKAKPIVESKKVEGKVIVEGAATDDIAKARLRKLSGISA